MAFPGPGRRGERSGGASLLSSVAELRGTRRAPPAPPAAPAHNRPRPKELPAASWVVRKSPLCTQGMWLGERKKGERMFKLYT